MHKSPKSEGVLKNGEHTTETFNSSIEDLGGRQIADGEKQI